MDIVVESVTPKKAIAWLNLNTSNRRLRNGVVEKYTRDMKNGDWTNCVAPISFYQDGEVADGQHRLWAIIDSGTTQRFIIVRGLNREDGINIDTGLNRDLSDSANISGVDKGLSRLLLVASKAIATGVGTSDRGISNTERLMWATKYREAANFCNSHVPRVKYMATGAMLGAIGRAYLHEGDKERLKRFASILKSGFVENEDETAAVAMRNYLLAKGITATSGLNWNETFNKAQNAIWLFMRRKVTRIVRTTEQERYPLIEPEVKRVQSVIKTKPLNVVAL